MNILTGADSGIETKTVARCGIKKTYVGLDLHIAYFKKILTKISLNVFKVQIG